jgi:hypothetical protein
MSWPLFFLCHETAVADEEADELGRVEAAEPAKESWGDGDAAPTPAHDGGACEASGGREPQEDLGEIGGRSYNFGGPSNTRSWRVHFLSTISPTPPYLIC